MFTGIAFKIFGGFNSDRGAKWDGARKSCHTKHRLSKKILLWASLSRWSRWMGGILMYNTIKLPLLLNVFKPACNMFPHFRLMSISTILKLLCVRQKWSKVLGWYHQAGLVNLLWAAPLYWKRSSDIRKVLSRNFRGEKWWYHTHNNGKRIGKLFDTLSAHQYEGNVLDISILGHLGVVIVDRVEGGLVLQTEHEYHGVHPRGKLKEKTMKRQKICWW